MGDTPSGMCLNGAQPFKKAASVYGIEATAEIGIRFLNWEMRYFLFSGDLFRFGGLGRFFGIHGAFEHGDCRDDEDAGNDPFDGVQRQRGDQEQADGNADAAE